MGAFRILLPLILAACSATPGAGPPAPPSPTAATSPAPAATSPAPAETEAPSASPTANMGAVLASIDFHEFSIEAGAYELVGGEESRATFSGGSVTRWTSPWRETGFPFTRLVPSWNAVTPEATWIEVGAQGRRASGGETAWYSFGKWAFGDTVVQRASLDGQRDGDGRIETDTLFAAVPLDAYRFRVTLVRSASSRSGPVLQRIAAVASDDAAVRSAPPSAHGGTVADLDVPQLSQEIHAGEYPQWDAGGEAWCSPTSTAMVLRHWGRGPTQADLEWVDRRYADPVVDHAARFTYDAAYGGTGNWTFNAAYAAQYGVRAFVTQLRSLAEAERFIASGIPLVASIGIPAGELPGFPLAGGARGHLLVIRGFTASGDIIANEPAAMSNAEVRRTYPRAAFERLWLSSSGGIVYVIHPADHPLPARIPGATPNW